MHNAVSDMQIKTPNLSRSQPQHHQLMMYILNAHQKNVLRIKENKNRKATMEKKYKKQSEIGKY